MTENKYHHERQANAFTLVELIVSISILAVLSALVIPNFSTFRQKRALTSQTPALVGLLRELQNAALTGTAYQGINASGYGMRISPLTPDRVLLFADIDGNHQHSGHAEDLKNATILLFNDVEIFQVFPALGVVDIDFSLPRADIFVNGERPTGDVSAKIELQHKATKATKVIRLNGISGQIVSD